MRSSLVARASDCQCTNCNKPGFDPSLRRHNRIWGAADETVLNIVRKIKKKKTPKILIEKKYIVLKINKQEEARSFIAVVLFGPFPPPLPSAKLRQRQRCPSSLPLTLSTFYTGLQPYRMIWQFFLLSATTYLIWRIFTVGRGGWGGGMMHKGNTGEKNVYVVFKWNIHGSTGK